MSTCPDCGQIYSPRGGGHCRARYGGCCQTFSNDQTGDKHRTVASGRCMTMDEMAEKGWRLTPRGWTHYPPRPTDTWDASGAISTESKEAVSPPPRYLETPEAEMAGKTQQER